MAVASLILGGTGKRTLARTQVADIEVPRTARVVSCRNAGKPYDVVAVCGVHVPVDAASQLLAGVANQGNDVLALLVDWLEDVGGESLGDEVFFGKGLLRGLPILGNLCVNEVLEVLRVVVVFTFVVEIETVVDVVTGAILRVDDFEPRNAVEVQVHAVFGLVAVVIDYDDVNFLVTKGVNLGFFVLDGQVEGVVVVKFFVLPVLGGFFLAAGVQVDLNACNGSKGVACKDGEGDVSVMLGPEGVLGNDQRGFCVDNLDPCLAGGCSGSVGCIIAVEGYEFGFVEAGLCVCPGLGLGVTTDDGRVLAVLLGQRPLETENLVHIVGQKTDHVDGIVNGNGQGVRDGVPFGNGDVGHGVGKRGRVHDGAVEDENPGVVVLQVDVFLYGRFPGTSEKG